jgi:hypothetical protein
MSPRDKKMIFILNRAKALWKKGHRETFIDLAKVLNTHGFRSDWGMPYHLGGRGVAKLVHCAYDYVHTEMGLGKTGAEPIAMAFTKADGTYAYY